MSALAQLFSSRLWTQSKPIVVALIVICICLLLLRPRRKPENGRQQQQQARGGAGSGAGASSSGRPTRGPMVSVSTVGTLLDFDRSTPRLLPGAVAALLQIAQKADVYLITTLPEDSDEVEAATVETLSAAGIFSSGACERCKAIFCATEDGRMAITRQLAPAVHVDVSPKVLQYLAPHVPRVVYVQPAGLTLEGVAAASPRPVSARSLADYAAIHCGAAA